MSIQRRGRRTAREIFAIPALVGMLSAAGLASALVGDGVWDAVSWLALLIPVALYGACVFVRRSQR